MNVSEVPNGIFGRSDWNDRPRDESVSKRTRFDVDNGDEPLVPVAVFIVCRVVVGGGGEKQHRGVY